MTPERAAELVALYSERFLPTRDPVWFGSYLAAVQEVQNATEAEFRTERFQQRLWELSDVSSVGLGSSVVVTGAYADPEIVQALWSLRQAQLPEDPLIRARWIDDEFDRILGLVSPRHNPRRPSAKLARILAALLPYEIFCLLDNYRTRHFRQWMQQPTHKLWFIGQHVLLRQSLREKLGAETGLEDCVSYSMFTWYLWETLLDPAQNDAPPKAAIGPTRATDAPQLVVPPAKSQRKGISYLSNNLDLLMSMIRASENGIDRESLDQQISEDAPSLSRPSRATLLAQAASLSLLAFANGSYTPTPEGAALLEGEPAAEVLTPIMARKVFGFAQILDDLRSRDDLSRGEIARLARSYYPRWTTDFAPNQLVAWMRELGLVNIDGVGTLAKVMLTEVGENWASGLPADMKTPALLLSDELPDEKAADDDLVTSQPAEGSVAEPPADDVLARFRADPSLASLVFSDQQIRMVHAALHAVRGKRFVLLAGLSGTGKTSMARGYARAYCAAMGVDPEAHYEQVAVWPDWTDPTGLLGFVNPLATPVAFQETRALRFLLNANANPDKPYFLCLDEMNLARVEHYFAPFLSAMEGVDGRLSLHANRDPVDGIPSAIYWPKNLYILGTVNMDETTFPFSDKVLDRAFTFEFWDVDLDGWRRSAGSRGNAHAVDRVYPVLKDMSDALKPARRHFGYRTCEEVLGFVGASAQGDAVAALDAAVLAKVLPKVRGDSGGVLPKAIDDAIEVCERHGLKDSKDKLQQMKQTLDEMGAVRFWS